MTTRKHIITSLQAALITSFVALPAFAQTNEAVTTSETTTTTTTITTNTNTDTTTSGTTGDAAGQYQSLSPGGKGIAKALYDAQFKNQPAEGETAATGTSTTSTSDGQQTQPMTLDQIAAAKADGQGWGNVFKDMKAQGLIDAKNLGEVVSSSKRASTSQLANTSTSTTSPDAGPEAGIVSANGTAINTVGNKGNRGSKTVKTGKSGTIKNNPSSHNKMAGISTANGSYGGGGINARGNHSKGIVTAAGGTVGSTAGAYNKHGHGGGRKASVGIVSASGGTYGSNAGAVSGISRGGGNGGAKGLAKGKHK